MPLALLPFIVLIAGLVMILVLDLVKPSPQRSYQLALFTVVGALMTQLLALLQTFSVRGGRVEVWKWIDLVMEFDIMSQVFSILALFLAFMAIGISAESFEEEQACSGEYYALMLTATLGAVMVAHAQELLTFFLAFEMLSIPLYTLAGFRRYNRGSAEAGLKYFLSGALSSAIFLFGASWVFGACGSTQYSEISKGFTQGNQQPLYLGVLLIVAAFAFKMAAAPFHMWAPDTYEGSPIPVAAFLSSVPKAVMLGASARLFYALTDHMGQNLMLVFAALAILSIVMGNLVALTQSELTRMAAYSGVAQMGYLLIGLAALIGLEGSGRPAMAVDALGSMLFYLIVYTVTNLAFWVILLTVAKHRGSTQLDAFNGLSQSAPFLSFCLLISVFSLAGVPPLAGFIGKLYLFRAAFYSQPLMAFFGVLGSVISLYYYFNILRRCYFLKPQDHQEPIEITGTTKGLLGLLLMLTIGGGLFPAFTKVCFILAEKMLVN